MYLIMLSLKHRLRALMLCPSCPPSSQDPASPMAPGSRRRKRRRGGYWGFPFVHISLLLVLSSSWMIVSPAHAHRNTQQQTLGTIIDLQASDDPVSRSSVIKLVRRRMTQLQQECEVKRRPFVTLSYAQSLDGSIAFQNRTALNISSHATLVLAHQLRAEHDCILIGAGTAKGDNPRLTVRFGIEGDRLNSRDPRPVILISAGNRGGVQPEGLRVKRPIIFTPDARSVPKCGSQKDYEVVECRAAASGVDGGGRAQRCDLTDCLERLWAMGYRRLMVEGGAGIISAFASAGLVDMAVITVSPRFLGGFRVFQAESASEQPQQHRLCLRLRDAKAVAVGPDMVLVGGPLDQAGLESL